MTITIFNRVPKTGSSSLKRYLSESLEELGIDCKGLVCHGFPHQNTINFLKSLSGAVHSPPPYLIGHMPMGVAEEFFRSHEMRSRTIMFLRDPAKRMKSHLAFLFGSGGIGYVDGKFYHAQYPWISLDLLLRDFQFKWLISFFSGVSDCVGEKSFWLLDKQRKMQAIRFDFGSTLKPFRAPLENFWSEDDDDLCMLATCKTMEQFIVAYLLVNFDGLDALRVKNVVSKICERRLNQTQQSATAALDWLTRSDFSPVGDFVGFTNPDCPSALWVGDPKLVVKFSELCLDLIHQPGFADIALWKTAITQNDSKASLFDWRAAHNLSF